MLAFVAKPTRHPSRSWPERAVTMNIGYSRCPTIVSKVALTSTSGRLTRSGGGSLGLRGRGQVAIRVRVGVVEDLERVLALADLDGEGLAGLRVADRDVDAAIDLAPEEAHVDPIARAAVELAHQLGRSGGHRWLL